MSPQAFLHTCRASLSPGTLGTSTPQHHPCSRGAARAPRFLRAWREHPQETFLPEGTIPLLSTRGASARFLTRDAARTLLSGRVVQGPFVALLEPPGSGVLPLTRRVPQLKAEFPQLPRRGSALVGSPASAGHGAVPHRGPCVLNSAPSGPHSQAARPQPGTEGPRACDTSSWERLRAEREGDDRR